MGFGFGLFFVFGIVPLSGIILIFWLISGDNAYGKMLQFAWSGLFGLMLLSSIIRFFSTKKEVRRSDIYGEYVIDRSKFPGKQANWQYANFRFKITKNDELIFDQMDGRKIIKSDTAQVIFVEHYVSDRIRILKDPNMCHVIDKTPTLYRNIWSFYYVFETVKFGNVFFKKGKWRPLRR